MWFRRYPDGHTETDMLITVLHICSHGQSNNEVGLLSCIICLEEVIFSEPLCSCSVPAKVQTCALPSVSACLCSRRLSTTTPRGSTRSSIACCQWSMKSQMDCWTEVALRYLACFLFLYILYEYCILCLFPKFHEYPRITFWVVLLRNCDKNSTSAIVAEAAVIPTSNYYCCYYIISQCLLSQTCLKVLTIIL